MSDVLQRALDLLADGQDVTWETLDAQAPDQATRDRLRELAAIAAIARAHAAPLEPRARVTPFEWGLLQVREHVARGAHGDVYRAWDPRLERDVALKLIRNDVPADSEATVAITEGRLLARVRHPNVAAVYGADRIFGQAGIWMEFLRGRTLREDIERRGRLPPEEVIRIGLEVCAGLGAIHGAGLIHRDVKAQNVMRTADGRTVLMDMGASHDSGDGAGSLQGTPMYLAPELLKGQRASAASEVYAVGVLLFYAVTGSYPVDGRTLDEIKRRHEHGHQPRFAEDRSLLPSFTAVVERALRRTPAERFRAVDDMAAALEDAARGRPRKRFHAAEIALAVLLTAASGGGVFLAARTARALHPFSASAGAGPGGAPDIRKLRLPSFTMGLPSRDGRLFPYVGPDRGIHVWEVATDRSRRVLAAGTDHESFLSPIMSPTGDRIVFGWSAEDAFELRIVNADGTWPRVLIARETAFEPVPADWSSDGRHILCWLRQKNGTADLALVPANGGRARVIFTSVFSELPNASLSPDGRFIVTSRQEGQTSRTELIIVALDGSAPRPLLPESTSDRFPIWTRDGGHIFFLRNSSQVPDAADGWLLRVANGRPHGGAVLTTPNLGRIASRVELSMTDAGEIYAIASTISADIYVAMVDLSGTSAPGPPTRILPEELGHHVAPAWSPDGRQMAYFTTGEPSAPGGTPPKTLTIQDMASRRTRRVPLSLSFLGGYSPVWLPEVESVIIWGRGERDGPAGYYRVDLGSGRTTPIVLTGVEDTPAFSQCSPDGRRFLYTDPARGVVSRDLATGHETIAVPKGAGTSIGRFKLSPDGASLAFVRTRQTTSEWTSVLELQRMGGRPRELARASAPEILNLQAWTPDGGAVLFTRGTGNRPHPLWRLSASGGVPRDMHFAIARTPNAISLSPDGRQMAYSERFVDPELWIWPSVLNGRPAGRERVRR